MRQLIAAPLLGLFLLGGCGQPQHILSEPETTMPAGTPSPGVASPMALRLASGFTPAEEAQIIAAVGDWNQRGGVRLDLASRTDSATAPGIWTITKPSGTSLAATDEWRVWPAVSLQRFPSGGGAISIDVNRLGPRDLRSELVKELEVAMNGDSSRRVVSAGR